MPYELKRELNERKARLLSERDILIKRIAAIDDELNEFDAALVKLVT